MQPRPNRSRGLGKTKGVKRVASYPKQHAVNIEFDGDGSATTRELLDAVAVPASAPPRIDFLSPLLGAAVAWLAG